MSITINGSTNTITAPSGVTVIGNMSVTGNATVGDASTDILTVQAGSASAPAIVPSGDTNTGVWFPAADTVAVSTGGTERMRIDSAGSVGIGTTSLGGTKLSIGDFAATASANGINLAGDVPAGATADVSSVRSAIGLSATVSLTSVQHFRAEQGTFTGTATNQYGFIAAGTLTGATNNYGFYSNVASGTGRWNFYAAGTASNYFAGDMQFDKTITAAATTGNQTINKNAGSVNFAAAATSLTVTNSRVTANSVIVATVATNDTTMKSVAVVAGSGSFVIHANAAATAETRVNFWIVN